ncbi:integral membrane protein [Lasiodiplodia theobromae]|nr:integral membrane protein [Lasiodiplodia theobromae]
MSQTAVVHELQHLHGDGAAIAVVATSAAARQSINELEEANSRSGSDDAPQQQQLSLFRLGTIAAAITGVLVASSMTTGLITVALPTMAKDLEIPEHLLLWCVVFFFFFFFLSGAIADYVGSRIVYLVGCLFLSLSMLASGLAQNSTQIIVFRGCQGVAASCCLPTAVSLMSEYFPGGRRRNVGFAIMGAGQPLGFSLGLFLSGFFVDSIGWRYSWYLAAAVAMAVFVVAIWALPRKRAEVRYSWGGLFRQLDVVGAGMASACLGILSYVLAMISDGPSQIRQGRNIALLCIAGALLPSFIFWMDLRTKRNMTALIPNALWKKTAFSTICVMVFFTWAVLNAVNFYSSLFFQDVQSLPALQTSLRFLPNAISGIILSIGTGMILHKFSAYWIVLAASVISALSPMLFAIAEPTWSYWYAQFWAMLLSAVAVDVLFVVSTLVITNIFPPSTQALAGAVFNTVAQFGGAVGLAVMAVISSNVTEQSDYAVKTSPPALLEGYRAAFWACFAAMILSVGIGCAGLRDVGKFGVKVE